MSTIHRLPKYDIRGVQKLRYEELVASRMSAAEVLAAPRHPIVAVLHNVRSLYNVGSLFRTADAFLISEVICVGFTPAPPRKEIAKTALGADATVPYRWFATITEAVASLRAHGYQIMAAEVAHGSIPADAIEKRHFPLAVIFGNELTGVSDAALELCDGALEIPMYGTKHSLNVAVAAGIVLHTLVERYREITT